MEMDTLFLKSVSNLFFLCLAIPVSTIFFKEEKLRGLDFLQAVQSKIFDRVSNRASRSEAQGLTWSVFFAQVQSGVKNLIPGKERMGHSELASSLQFC